MGFKEWWKKLSYWKKGLIIGIIFGLVVYFLNLGGWTGRVDAFEFTWVLGSLPFCKILHGCEEEYAFTFLFWGWLILGIFYGLIGASLGLLISIKKH